VSASFRELAEIELRRFGIGRMGRFFGRKSAQFDVFSVHGYLADPAASVASCALKATFTPAFLIGTILRLRARTKVVSAIVKAVAIAMIDFFRVLHGQNGSVKLYFRRALSASDSPLRIKQTISSLPRMPSIAQHILRIFDVDYSPLALGQRNLDSGKAFRFQKFERSHSGSTLQQSAVEMVAA
jgi:hypothetical protein